MAITSILGFELTTDAASVVDLLKGTLTDTRNFPGCQSLQVLVDETDPKRITIVEVWDSEESDLAYRAWRATEEGASNLGEIIAGVPTLTKYSTLLDL
jgi:quinol monooxygenase YgiN